MCKYNSPWSRGKSITVVLGNLLHPPVYFLPFHLFFTLSERSSSFDHLVDETPEAEPVGTEGVLLVIDDLRGHVTHGANTASHSLALWDLHSQSKVGNS